MIDKPLYIIIFMYSVSFMMLAVQYIFADTLGFTMTDINGDPLKPSILTSISINQLNAATNNIVTGNFTVTDIASAFISAGLVLIELLSILTGTYIFSILVSFGIPLIIITPLVILYIILLGNMIIVRIRGS